MKRYEVTIGLSEDEFRNLAEWYQYDSRHIWEWRIKHHTNKAYGYPIIKVKEEEQK